MRRCWLTSYTKAEATHFLDEVDDEDGDFGLLVEALRCSEVANRLDMVLGARHALDDGEGSEGDGVAQHLELEEEQASAGFVSFGE